MLRGVPSANVRSAALLKNPSLDPNVRMLGSEFVQGLPVGIQLGRDVLLDPSAGACDVLLQSSGVELVGGPVEEEGAEWGDEGVPAIDKVHPRNGSLRTRPTGSQMYFAI